MKPDDIARFLHTSAWNLFDINTCAIGSKLEELERLLKLMLEIKKLSILKSKKKVKKVKHDR